MARSEKAEKEMSAELERNGFDRHEANSMVRATSTRDLMRSQHQKIEKKMFERGSR